MTAASACGTRMTIRRASASASVRFVFQELNVNKRVDMCYV